MLGSGRWIAFTWVAAVALAACTDGLERGTATQDVDTPTITTDRTSYPPSSPVTVEFSGMPGNEYDWIAVAPVGSPDTFYNGWQYTYGAVAGSDTFTGLVNTGNFEARAFLNNTYTLLATSSPFTITYAVTPTVTTDEEQYAPGATVTVSYTNLPGNPYDWVAVSVGGSPDTSYVQWDYTNGQVNGSQAFSGLAGNTWYEARTYVNDTYTVLARSSWFELSLPTVSTSKPTYGSSESPELTYSGLPGNEYDWVAFAQAGAPDDSFISWEYTHGVTSGTLYSAPLPAGNYEARAFLNDSYTLLGSSTFTVISNAPPPPSMTTDSSTYTSTQPVTISWANIVGDDAWIDVAAAGSPYNSWVEWEYINNTGSGSWTVPALSPGNYEARAFNNGAYTFITSTTFTVTP